MEQVLAPEVSLVRDGSALTLRLTGVVGVLCAAELRDGAVALAEHAGPVALDAAGAEHLDCSATQILLALAARFTEEGRTPPRLEPGERARRYLMLTGLATPLGLA